MPDCLSMASTRVVLPWSTWAMMAILRMSFVMFVKALETKMAADTTAARTNLFLHQLQVRSLSPYFSRRVARESPVDFPIATTVGASVVGYAHPDFFARG